MPASTMCFGVGKSGSPTSRWMTERPLASSARAASSTSSALSVPSERTRVAIRGIPTLYYFRGGFCSAAGTTVGLPGAAGAVGTSTGIFGVPVPAAVALTSDGAPGRHLLSA